MLLLVVLLILYTVYGKECSHKSYFIEHKSVVEGRNIATFPASSVDECAQKCSLTSNCDAANFLLNPEDHSICMLVNSSEASGDSLTPLAASVVYSLRQFCTETKDACVPRQWSFEKHHGYDTLDETYILGEISNVTLEQCLNSCLRSKQCEASLYDKKSKQCRLSKVTLNNVNSIKQHFAYSERVDLYESNCVKRRFNTRNCGFTRINQAGFIDIFDSKIEKVQDLTQCENICLDWRFGTCRSYTYDKKTNSCYLSHNGQRATGRSVLETIDNNLAYGELEDCVNFELDCRAKSVRLIGSSFKLFKGFIRTKKGKQIVCERNVTNSYEFETIFGFDECGIQKIKKNQKIYSGMIMVKEGSTDLITVHDKMIEIKCKIHEAYHDEAAKGLNYRIEIQDPNATLSLDSDVPKSVFDDIDQNAQFQLDVLDKNGRLAQVVEPGDDGYLLITLDGMLSSESQFVVSDLYAEDESDVVKLIDSEGCVVNSTLVTSLSRPANNQLKIGIRFSGFSEQSQVTYRTLGKICHTDCDLQCNKDYYRRNEKIINQISDVKLLHRIRRQADKAVRKFTLAEDVYGIVSKNTVRLQRREILPNVHVQFDKNFDNLIDDKELQNVINELDESKSSGKKAKQQQPLSLGCFNDDLNCMFTVTMAILQFLLMISCSCIVYSVAKKWIRYYRNRGRRMSQMPDDISRFSDEVSAATISQSDLTTPSAMLNENLNRQHSVYVPRKEK